MTGPGNIRDCTRSNDPTRRALPILHSFPRRGPCLPTRPSCHATRGSYQACPFHALPGNAPKKAYCWSNRDGPRHQASSISVGKARLRAGSLCGLGTVSVVPTKRPIRFIPVWYSGIGCLPPPRGVFCKVGRSVGQRGGTLLSPL